MSRSGPSSGGLRAAAVQREACMQRARRDVARARRALEEASERRRVADLAVVDLQGEGLDSDAALAARLGPGVLALNRRSVARLLAEAREHAATCAVAESEARVALEEARRAESGAEARLRAVERAIERRAPRHVDEADG